MMIRRRAKICRPLALMAALCVVLHDVCTSLTAANALSTIGKRLGGSNADRAAAPAVDRSADATAYREYCPSCRRPSPTQCLCEHIPSQKIALETEVLILQHPVEFRRKTISTVSIIQLVLERVRVLVGRSFDASQVDAIIDDAIADGRLPLLLFPGQDAITLEDDDAVQQLVEAHTSRERCSVDVAENDGMALQQQTPSRGKYLLILVDGTWTQAKRMLRNSPALLERCQKVQFTDTAASTRSIYDSIRKQPDSHCLSTLECCERTLRLLEPHNPDAKVASDHLLNSLMAMILKQMEHERSFFERNPDLVRNASKVKAKEERQRELLLKAISGDRTELDETCTKRKETGAPALPEGYTIRPLAVADGKYVDSRWPFRSTKSLTMIERQIRADAVNATVYGRSTCLGIEFEDRGLVGCIIRHKNGSVGILHVDEGHRRSGLGLALLNEATDALLRRNEKAFAFIFDGNDASEALFAEAGWKKADPSGRRCTG